MRKRISKSKLRKIIDHFAKHDRKIFSAMQSVNFNDWIKPVSEEDYFINLCREIVGQQLSGKAANTIFSRFLEMFEGNPQPQDVVITKDEHLSKAGLSKAKTHYIKELSRMVHEKQIDLISLGSHSDEEIIEKLTNIKGIGNWTAEMFLIFTLGRDDVFSFGDLGVRKGMEKLYKLERPSAEKVKKIIDKWTPYKTYGTITLWHHLDSNR